MENLRSANKPKVSDQLLEMARKEPDAVLKELESQSNGLSMAEAVDIKILTGDNEIVTAYICKQLGVPVASR